MHELEADETLGPWPGAGRVDPVPVMETMARVTGPVRGEGLGLPGLDSNQQPFD